MRWNAQVLSDVLTRNAELYPQQEALIIGEQRFTYGELHPRVDETARGLRALGIRRGDHVAVCFFLRVLRSLLWVSFLKRSRTCKV